MMIEGILSIQAGESPALIEKKLNAYLLEKEEKKQKAALVKKLPHDIIVSIIRA